MASIIVGFSRPRARFKPFSWLIRLFDGTPYSHTYIKFYSTKYDRWLIYQASHLMVNFMGEKRFHEEAVVCREFSISVSDDAMSSIVTFAIDNAGAKYNIKAVFGIAFVKIANALGFSVKKNPFTGDGFFCSRIVGDIMVDKIGDKLEGDPNLWTPLTIYEVLDRGV